MQTINKTSNILTQTINKTSNILSQIITSEYNPPASAAIIALYCFISDLAKKEVAKSNKYVIKKFTIDTNKLSNYRVQIIRDYETVTLKIIEFNPLEENIFDNLKKMTNSLE